MKEIEGFFNFEDVYDSIAQEAPAGSTIVEVGVYRGKSLIYLAKKVAERNAGIQVVGVDYGRGIIEGGFDFKGMVANDILTNLIEHQLSDDVPIILWDSAKAAKLFADQSCWCVYIDADHRYEAIQKDIMAWKPKIVRGGILAGHDHNDCFPGVQRAVAELLDPKRLTLHTKSSSWIVRF
jgi:hypothetical protein